MIYLVGVDHQVQHRKSDQLSIEFANYLSTKAKELNINLVCEEWFQNLLEENGVKTSVPQDVANKCDIKHMFCDPNREERKKNWMAI